jgi:hypothetical protein
LHELAEKVEISPTAKPNSPLPAWLVILAIYSFITAVITFPFVFQLGSHIFSNVTLATNDTFHSLWYLWWYGRALELGQDPTQTNLLFGLLPNVQVLLISVINGLLMLPVRWLFGILVAYNLTIFLSFPLAALFTYQLTGEFTRNRLARFTAGFLFAFTTYHLYRAEGHMGLTTVQWLPFFAWRLFALRRNPTLANGLWAGLGFALASLSDLHYLGFFILPFTVLYLLYFAIFDRKSGFWTGNNLRGLAVALVLGVILTAPFYLSFLRLEKDVADTVSLFAREVRQYSADLLAFFLPNPRNPLFGSFTTPLYANFTNKFPIEQAVYPGYVLLVAALAVFVFKRGRTSLTFFWFVAALSGLVFALGTRLHINGTEFGFPLPYTVYTYIPLLNTYRTPNRFAILLLLALVVLASIALTWLFEKVAKLKPHYRLNFALAVIIMLAAFLESTVYPFPLPTTPVPNPAIYRQIADEPDDFLVLELPLAPLSLPMYYQTQHQKRLIGGYPLRPTNRMSLSFDQTPYLTLFNPAESSALMDGFAANLPNPEIFPLDLSFKQSLQISNIRYVILRSYPQGRRFFRWMRPYLEKHLGTPTWKENDTPDQDPLLAWRIEPGNPLPPVANNNLRLRVGDGWNAGLGISNDGKLQRVLRQDGKILIESGANQTLKLTFGFTPVIRPQTLEVRLNGALVAEIKAEKEWVKVVAQIPNLSLLTGQNILEFRSKEGCLVAADYIPDSRDFRCISLFVQDLNLQN